MSGKKSVLLYSCCGATDIGHLADQIARQLAADGAGRVACLAAVGAGNSGFVQSARSADLAVAIDGCAMACGKQILDRLGIRHLHVAVTDFGVERGKTIVTGNVIDSVTEKVRTAICEELKHVE
jgi:uncharacterized metal-binding protein